MPSKFELLWVEDSMYPYMLYRYEGDLLILLDVNGSPDKLQVKACSACQLHRFHSLLSVERVGFVKNGERVKEGAAPLPEALREEIVQLLALHSL